MEREIELARGLVTVAYDVRGAEPDVGIMGPWCEPSRVWISDTNGQREITGEITESEWEAIDAALEHAAFEGTDA